MLNELLEYCFQQFDGNGGCDECDRACTRRCEDCLRAIHWDTGERYWCSNSIYFYVGKHVPRYASEIRYVLEAVDEFRQFETFRVLSLGCGPCSDLWGILDYNIHNGLNRNISYIGYDINDIWNNIIRKNHEILDNIRNFRLRYGTVTGDVANNDFFATIRDRGAIRANLVVLQYVISDMVKNNVDMNRFLNNLYLDLISRLQAGSIIIINDINRDIAARNNFDRLCDVINENSLPGSFEFRQFYFNNDYRQRTFPYGSRHPANEVFYNYDENVRGLFDPWTSCQSAQLVIRKLL